MENYKNAEQGFPDPNSINHNIKPPFFALITQFNTALFSMKKKVYFENLDGLRFLCFLSVFFFHSFFTPYESVSSNQFYQFIKTGIFKNGNIGVNFFFVLSGFLITYILIEEKKVNGNVNIPNFWKRRVLRIWPLYYLCVFLGFIIFPIVNHAFGHDPIQTATPFYYLTFISNFDLIHKGLPPTPTLTVLWSVSIEEQFYLVWPIILFLFPVKKYWIPFTIVMVASLIFRACYDTKLMHELHTLSCAGDMAIGAFGAWAVHLETFKKRIENLGRFQILSIYILFLVAFLFRDKILFANHYLRIFERALIAILALMIILEQSYAHKSFFKMSGFKTITKLGLITYGLYCLHFIGIIVATIITKRLNINTQVWQVLLVDTSLALLISIVISKISYRYFEQFFLKLKDKFAYITK